MVDGKKALKVNNIFQQIFTAKDPKKKKRLEDKLNQLVQQQELHRQHPAVLNIERRVLVALSFSGRKIPMARLEELNRFLFPVEKETRTAVFAEA